ncbi:MAG: hypothetical protein K8J09_15925 [Planctomycetes bacterium]|nr:hypothetical protein [Planctomycetota bacterium]MCC7397424.1 hypothetical protein [Planctomycetota bacterium]
MLRTSIEEMHLVTNVLGSASFSMAVPPVPNGVFYAQAISFDPAANPLGLTTSNAVRLVIGL